MAAIKGFVALPLLLMMVACTTTGDKISNTNEPELIASVVATDTSVKKGEPIVPPMDEAQREALDMALEVMRAGEWLAARELMQELIINHPMLAVAYANMGNIHHQLGDTENAEKAWLKALDLRSNWPEVYNQLGIFYRDQARFDESLAMYRKAIAADEGYARSHHNIAILYELYLGEGEKALMHYRRYRELVGGDEREVLLWIADLERRVKRAGE